MRYDIDSEFVTAIFAALMTIDTHKEEIGPEHFPQLMGYLTEFVIKGLADCPK